MKNRQQSKTTLAPFLSYCLLLSVFSYCLLFFLPNFASFLSSFFPPLSPTVCSGLKAGVASQNRAAPVRGESCWLCIDWTRHALWWLMLKRFLTKRICKRCVTHRVFSIPLFPMVGLFGQEQSNRYLFTLELLTGCWKRAKWRLANYSYWGQAHKYTLLWHGDRQCEGRLYSLLESHRDQSNSYSDWSCLAEETVVFWCQETKTGGAQGEQLAVLKWEWKSPFIKGESLSLNTGPQSARSTAGCPTPHAALCLWVKPLLSDRFLFLHFLD